MVFPRWKVPKMGMSSPSLIVSDAFQSTNQPESARTSFLRQPTKRVTTQIITLLALAHSKLHHSPASWGCCWSIVATIVPILSIIWNIHQKHPICMWPFSKDSSLGPFWWEDNVIEGCFTASLTDWNHLMNITPKSPNTQCKNQDFPHCLLAKNVAKIWIAYPHFLDKPTPASRA